MKRITIDTDSSIVVSGKSILSSSSKLLQTDCKRCTYLEYKTFSDFLECMILYDKVFVLGAFNNRENPSYDLMKKLNRLNGSKFIRILDDSDDKLFINKVNVDKVIKEVIDDVFGKEISFIRKQLLPKSYTYRYNDDEKSSFIDQVTLCEADKNIYQHIKELVISRYNTNFGSEFVKHLLRGIVIASVATIIKGTAKFTGSRKPLGIIIKKNNPKGLKYDTTLQTIYNHANSLYLKSQNPSVGEYYRSLLYSAFLALHQKNNDPLSIIILLRNQFEGMRKVYGQKNFISKARSDKYAEEIKNTRKYYTEVYRNASSKDFVNLGKKYSKELFLDENSVEMKYEFGSTEDEDIENSNTTTGINLIKVIKYLVKFSVTFGRYKKIQKKNKPLISFFVQLINSKLILSRSFVNIDEFYDTKMKSFDEFIIKHNI